MGPLNPQDLGWSCWKERAWQIQIHMFDISCGLKHHVCVCLSCFTVKPWFSNVKSTFHPLFWLVKSWFTIIIDFRRWNPHDLGSVAQGEAVLTHRGEHQVPVSSEILGMGGLAGGLRMNWWFIWYMYIYIEFVGFIDGYRIWWSLSTVNININLGFTKWWISGTCELNITEWLMTI